MNLLQKWFWLRWINNENGHASYKYEEYEDRQKEIEKELGCKFIRVTDKESDEYNIGLVIKELFNITVVS